VDYRVNLKPKAVPFDEHALDRSWKWLKNDEIRRLTMTPDFTREEQRTWFLSLSAQSDYLVWAIEIDSLPVGAFGLKHISDSSAEYWGYIGEKQHWGRGVGGWMVEQAITKAQDLKLQRLWLRVGHDNERAQRLYLRCGFHRTAEDPSTITMERNV
jgi:RimJ/RimL family protein N-acetyltransferase